MSIARITVLHTVLTSKGWLPAGTEDKLDASEAREHEARGYVDVLDVDGAPEVWAPCCGPGDHDHT